MAIEVKINNRQADIEILDKNGAIYKVLIDGREYEIDVIKLEKGRYSILYKGKSINIEVFERDDKNKYTANAENHHYEIELIDALSRYRKINETDLGISEHTITSPMPGKVVKIHVREGDKIKSGQTLVIVSAMKMDSEYKSHTNGSVSKVFVNEGDTVDGHQPLIEIEPDENK